MIRIGRKDGFSDRILNPRLPRHAQTFPDTADVIPTIMHAEKYDTLFDTSSVVSMFVATISATRKLLKKIVEIIIMIKYVGPRIDLFWLCRIDAAPEEAMPSHAPYTAKAIWLASPTDTIAYGVALLSLATIRNARVCNKHKGLLDKA